MNQDQMWVRMKVFLRHMFRQHDKEGKFIDSRERLKEELRKEEVNPDMIEAFEKDLYSDAWHGEEGFKPLSDTEKYLIAHYMIWKLFGKDDFQEVDFIHEAEGVNLRPEDLKAIIQDNWPNWKPK